MVWDQHTYRTASPGIPPGGLYPPPFILSLHIGGDGSTLKVVEIFLRSQAWRNSGCPQPGPRTFSVLISTWWNCFPDSIHHRIFYHSLGHAKQRCSTIYMVQAASITGSPSPKTVSSPFFLLPSSLPLLSFPPFLLSSSFFQEYCHIAFVADFIMFLFYVVCYPELLRKGGLETG